MSLKTAQAEGEWSHISPATHPRHQAAAPLPAPLLHVAGWMVVAPEGSATKTHNSGEQPDV